MRRRLSTIAAGASLCAVATTLSGCAELMLVGNVTTMVAAMPSSTAHWVETNRLTFAYPPDVVLAVIVEVVERHERRIVEPNPDAQSLRVSYPFSWLKNNWGGTLTITCAASELGTTVTIMGDGRDAVPRVRAIGDGVLDDVGRALRRQPRTL
jgi:hypothetical protein